ncbi:MAG: alanine racemase [Bacteroidales bacterium]|nr:alanine racemase [Bacteroidales bacterium]
MTVQELSDTVSAHYAGEPGMLSRNITLPLTDSRSLFDPEATVFFALRTAVGRDGHSFIPELYAAGVRVFVVDKEFTAAGAYPQAAFLTVDSPMRALRQSAAALRTAFHGKVVGITGSRGKTIVKEMLYAYASAAMRVCRSPRSYNSQIGLPLSLWQLTPEAQMGVFEVGVSRKGEMEALAQILRPEVGIFTALTDEHSAGFASDREKCREKARLFRDCRTIVYDGSNPVIESVLQEMYPGKELIPCDSYAAMVRAVAGDLGVEMPAPVKSRIDFTDTDAGTTLALDHFTCDVSGLTTALDALRRRNRDRPGHVSAHHAAEAAQRLTVVLGDLVCNSADKDAEYARLGRVLTFFGVSRLITAGPEIALRAMEYAEMPFEVSALTDDLQAQVPVNSSLYINMTDKAAAKELYYGLATRRNVTRMEVNLDALAANWDVYRSLVPPETRLIGMIKADGYGCGDLEVARTIQGLGAAMVAVAVVDEGVALRRGGVTIPILVLDPWCENMRAIFANNLQPTIIDGSEEMLNLLEQNATAEGVHDIYVHLKFDTGMHRVGLHIDDIDGFVERLSRHPRIHIASVFSHLATADCLDKDSYTDGQLELFHTMTDRLISGLGYPVKRHILNTAGITRYAHKHVYEMARLGIGLYGILPDESLAPMTPRLSPVARLVTRVIALNRYPAGTTVGYGCRGVLTRPSVIATIPVGYADGIDRHLGRGAASFLVGGVPCPTVGNICMDLCMIDVTDAVAAAEADSAATPVEIGTEVEIFGPNAPIERLATILDTIAYEVLARISPRVRRLYFRE